MIELTIQRLVVRNPTLSATPAKPGDELTLAVDAPYISSSQWIEFRILDGQEPVDTVRSKRGKTSATWVAPNLEDQVNLTFKALLRDAPRPANGQLAVLGDVTSPVLVLNGSKVDITAIDECFVPKQEQLNVTFTVTAGAAAAAAAGRYEIWGERYPGKTPAPLYTEPFAPAPGVATTWSGWDGKANHGELSGSYITPEFSPYRLRIVVGPDAGTVKDAYGGGLGLVAVAERNFEVRVNAVHIRLMEDFKDGASKDQYKLASALKIEPRQVNGDYADEERLPSRALVGPPVVAEETMRLRIPTAKHSEEVDTLGSGGQNVGDSYMPAGETLKQARDKLLCSRPELAIEFEPRLKSRLAAVNDDEAQQGLFEADAIGPLRIEPIALDHYAAGMFGGGASGTYWENAASKVKRGQHDAPYHDGANHREFGHWLARLVVANDGDRDFDVTAADPDYFYAPANDELAVYLNHALLKVSALANDTELDDGKLDYREIAGAPATQIRLRPDFTKAGDVLWISRFDSALAGSADEVERWNAYPPGLNCHRHFGGERGEEPTAELSNRFRAKFSPRAKKPREPIIGRSASGDLPYSKHIDLHTAPGAAIADQERVLTTALTSGKKKGLAGVVFSPSAIAGDRYKLHAWVWTEPYARRFGCVDRKPAVDGETGLITVWRLARIETSLRMPDQGTAGLSAVVANQDQPIPGPVGNWPELGIGVPVPVTYPATTQPSQHPADAINLSFSAANGLNPMFEPACIEWVIGDKGHRDVDLKKYRAAHNKATKAYPGRIKLKNNGQLQNWMSIWDHYREELPFGITQLRNLVSNTIAGLPKGTSSRAAGDAVRQAIVAHGANPDVALANGVTAIPFTARASQDAYDNWVVGTLSTIYMAVSKKLLGTQNPAKAMNVVRWPSLHEPGAWTGYDEINDACEYYGYVTTGMCPGDGMTIMSAADPDDSFPHEMGHSLNLVHFVAGNFEWKHHDVNTQDCLMSYDYTTGTILPSNVGAIVGPTGGGAASREAGWPDATGQVAPDDWGIVYDSLTNLGQQRGALCAKCALKLRGWKDDELPFAWGHPDLY